MSVTARQDDGARTRPLIHSLIHVRCHSMYKTASAVPLSLGPHRHRPAHISSPLFRTRKITRYHFHFHETTCATQRAPLTTLHSPRARREAATAAPLTTLDLPGEDVRPRRDATRGGCAGNDEDEGSGGVRACACAFACPCTCCVRCVCVDTCCGVGFAPNSWPHRDTTSACTCSTCTPDMIQTSKRYSVPTCSRRLCVESAHA